MKVGYNFLGVIVKGDYSFLFSENGNLANSENIKTTNENLKKILIAVRLKKEDHKLPKGDLF